ncbi:MAG: hypothetical protein ABR549_02190 [Mycobacteriales bacterium]
MTRRGVRAGQRGATTLSLLGAALAQGQGAADALPPPPAECHDMAITFENVSYRSYDVVIRAIVTRPGVFQLGDGHGYFGTSETPADPNGVPMTATATIITPEPGAEERWTASCIGGHATGVVRVPAAPAPPRLTVRGPLTVRATGHHGVANPLVATAVDGRGRRLPARCAPAILPLTPARTRVTCTSARDSAGRVGKATRTVTVLGAAAQLGQLRDSLGAGRLRELVESARAAVVQRDGAAAARRLGLVLDALPTSGLRGQRLSAVRADIVRIGHVVGRAIPAVHAVRPGDSVWSVVAAALQHKTGVAPDDHAIALGVRLVLAVNPGALDRYGVLHPGTVLSLPL